MASVSSTFPPTYAAAGSGVARRRRSVPSSRSTAMDTARDWKLVSTMPVATMPGRKYWAKPIWATSVPWSSLPKTLEKIASMTIG